MLEDFFSDFSLFLRAPNGAAKLRELIMAFAVQGRLTSRVSGAEDSAQLIRRLRSESVAAQDHIRPRRGRTGNPSSSANLPSFPLPTGWNWCRLDEISSYIQRGKGPKYVETSEVAVVSQKCVQWSGFDLSRARFIDPSTFNSYSEERFLREGDLLWNSTGTGTIGRVNLFSVQEDERIRAVADSHVTVVRVMECNPAYVWLWLASPYVQSTIESTATGSTNQIELATAMVKAQPIPVPPLQEQDVIVARARELLELAQNFSSKMDENRQLRMDLTEAYVHHLGELSA